MRIFQSPVKRFPGSVNLPDAYTFSQLIAWEQALDAAQADGQSNNQQWQALLPGILACVERFEINGLPEQPTVDTFPATPRKSVGLLLRWLIDCVGAVIAEDEDAPNA